VKPFIQQTGARLKEQAAIIGQLCLLANGAGL